MKPVLSTEEVVRLEDIIEREGTSKAELMELAGEFAANEVLKRVRPVGGQFGRRPGAASRLGQAAGPQAAAVVVSDLLDGHHAAPQVIEHHAYSSR